MRSAARAARVRALFRRVEGRDHPLRSQRKPRLSAAPMKRLHAPRPIRANPVLIVAGAAAACLALSVVGRETIWRRPPILPSPASSTAVKSPAPDAQALAAPSDAAGVAPPAR